MSMRGPRTCEEKWPGIVEQIRVERLDSYEVMKRWGISYATAWKLRKKAGLKGRRGPRVDVERNRANELSVVIMRKTGSSYQAIGDSLGFTRQRAHQIWKRVEK